MKYCHFLINEDSYGIPISSTQEFLEDHSWTPLPNNPYHLIGTLNLRGKIIPMVHLRSLLEEDEDIIGNTVIILRNEDRDSDEDQYALVVDKRLPIIETLNYKQFQHESQKDESIIEALLKREEEVITLLKVEDIIKKVLPDE